MKREIEIKKLQNQCEKRLAEAEKQMKLFEKQKHDQELKDKELEKLRIMYRLYMNEQIEPPSQGYHNLNHRGDRDSH